MLTRRDDRTKVLSRNAIIGKVFELESEKESKYDNKNILKDFLQILEVSVSLYTTNTTYMCSSTVLVLANFRTLRDESRI